MELAARTAGESPVYRVFFGAGSRVITPQPGCEMTGFIARQQPMAGVHDDLTVRVMVWADDAELTNAAALVTFDLIDLEAGEVASIRSRIEAATGIRGERIGVTCTHTHGGPASMGSGRLGRVEPGYLDRVRELAVEAAQEAATAIEPVTMRWGLGQETTVGKNRRIRDGLIDPDVPVLRFQRADGTVTGLLVSYACHPVTLGPNNLLATADYPGYVRRSIEGVYPGIATQFATGCCGQINNGHTSRDGERGQGMHWRTFSEAERIGRAIAGAAIQAAEQVARLDAALPVIDFPEIPLTIRTASRIIDLPFLPPPDQDELARLRAEWDAKEEAIRARGARTGELEGLQVYREWSNEVESGPTETSVPAEIMVIAIGDVTIAMLPGESFVEFGLAIKESQAPRPVMTLAYANGRPGYIPHRSAYAAGGYEVDEAYRYYGAPACYAPEAGELIVQTAIELASSLAGTGTGAREAAT